ncbi:beta-ketoacyl synthase [Halothiobacillus neapolitanus]|uniref:Beta-ketoacyl synthase n=1 Tax=Halothiobacillus neapolitanus (strain ATCC 23641 / DSM 15147 / CIP 104769 / NCIMB 8539 / c2) TaxID=555778 RepID=D0KZB9_HALNC|nr:beta-ketoacyl synthase [Halothiobacillus neapolitanus]ACX95792.1 Beta-ketoacyl synthase [Halothiobacillus neapolitanus c2]TDN66099.1 acetoacetyl-[acyl-carrier protein] synthase [Halothiobacillus neapolitanus]
MVRFPVIVGFGGVNAAGRSSFHHGYGRIVAEAMPAEVTERTVQSLARLMNLDLTTDRRELFRLIEAGTLVRKIESNHFDPDNMFSYQHVQLSPDVPLEFVCQRDSLPKTMPHGWQVTPLNEVQVKVSVSNSAAVAVPLGYESRVKVAGQLPTGFNPGAGYASHHHPRGIQMTVFGASDALQSIGIEWDVIRSKIKSEEVGVYAGSAMGQLDKWGTGGMISARWLGRSPSSKQCALGFSQMPADFINAYLLGNIGLTRSNMGACASFLYNLQLAVHDIQVGRVRVAVVGSSEAPILPEVVEGYGAMSALATDEKLCALDHARGLVTPNYRRASRPFGDNCGFVLAESAQFVVLFDDTLALEMGATIHGAVSDVFVHADGYKRSIASPGVGNYITLARAVASAKALLGDAAVRHRSFVQAHGSSTPQNRVTESHILSETARAFGIENWPIAAMKSYLGHSLAAAAGDQVIASLGVWAHGVIPGITTIDRPAEDVHRDRLDISPEHKVVGAENIDVAIVNAKGFGGNNASAALIAPRVVQNLLDRRHGSTAILKYWKQNEAVQESAACYEKAILAGQDKTIYRFGTHALDDKSVHLSSDGVSIDGYSPILFDKGTRYSDLDY